PWQSTEMRQTRLVFIGRSLDSQRIEQALTRVG
ncbi:MAG: GTP-binding protein, partial [Microcystis aeruginosa]